MDLFDQYLSLDTSVYYMKWSNVQQAVVVPVGALPVNALVNGPSASGVGIDFGATVRPLDGLDLSLALSWNNLEMDGDVISSGDLLFKKGDRLDYSPQMTAGLSAAYTFGLGAGYKARLNASGNYTAKQEDHAVNFGVAELTHAVSLALVGMICYILAQEPRSTIPRGTRGSKAAKKSLEPGGFRGIFGLTR